MASGVYVITAPSGSQYVGSTVDFEKRWYRHRRDLLAGRHHTPGLRNAASKYGIDSLVFSKVVICRRGDLLLYEQIAIDAMAPKYNVCRVAGSCAGVKLSQETRRKISEAQKGVENTGRFGAHRHPKRVVFTDEIRAKMSAAKKKAPANPKALEAMRQANIGRKLAPEHADRLGAMWRGKPMPDDQKAKFSEAKKKNWADPQYRAMMLAARKAAAEKRGYWARPPADVTPCGEDK